MSPGENDPGFTGCFFNIQQQGPDAIMHSVIFLGNLLVARHFSFSVNVQTNREFMAVHSLNDTCDNLSDLVAVIIILSCSFSLTDALLDNLPCCLSCDPSEIFRCAFNQFQVSQLGIRIDFSSLFNQNLGAVVLDVFHDFLLNEYRDLTGLKIDFCLYLLGAGCVYRTPIG